MATERMRESRLAIRTFALPKPQEVTQTPLEARGSLVVQGQEVHAVVDLQSNHTPGRAHRRGHAKLQITMLRVVTATQVTVRAPAGKPVARHEADGTATCRVGRAAQ